MSKKCADPSVLNQFSKEHMAFQIDTSSINSASKRLEVIGNNVANANTVGFKGSDFDDVLATSMSGDVGTKKAGTRQSFTQGNITASSNPLDVAISGKGMFRVEGADGGVSYTRNGQFKLDKDGFVVNATGDKLTGFGVDAKSGAILAGVPIPLTISQTDLPPIVTTNATMDLTVDSREPVIDTAAAGYSFSQTDPSTYTHSTTTTVYNKLGEAMDVQTFFTKKSATDWEVHAAVNGQLVKAPASWNFTFGANGALASSTGTTTTGALSIPVSDAVVTFDFSKASQFGSTFKASAVQDGSGIGQMVGYKIGSDGVITNRYSNGKSVIQGQLALANFKNLEGLNPTENNQWTESVSSGPAVLSKPGESGTGSLEASATEDANIDLTTEMIKMISAQRVYQAAAEMVKKQDEIMQTVVNIGN
jgi:flagellar hook protein FlgE